MSTDFSLTTFTDQGILPQVVYSMKAVDNGENSIVNFPLTHVQESKPRTALLSPLKRKSPLFSLTSLPSTRSIRSQTILAVFTQG